MISTRILTQKDKSLFMELYRQTIIDDFVEYSINARKYMVGADYSEKMFAKEIKLGAFEDDKLVGYLIADDPIGGVLFVEWLAISKDNRSQGAGTLLLKEIEKISLELGVHNLKLDCDQRNLEFYKKMGFEIIGLDKKSYFGADDYKLKKLIQEPKEENYLKEFK